MYVVERWLARLSRSPYAGDFVLKGGMLLASLGNRRPTVDADALARNLAADEEAVAARVVEIAGTIGLDDGVEFLPETTTTAVIRDEGLYTGVRVTMTARLATAEVKLRLDINFGDPVTPGPREVELPSLRPDGEAVRVLGYPIETVLAEKITTAIELGQANTRVRDWADIYTLTGTHEMDYSTTRAAFDATSRFRGVESRPLSDAVGDLATLRRATYAAYRKTLGTFSEPLPEDFSEVVRAVSSFADPLTGRHDGDLRWYRDLRQWRTL